MKINLTTIKKINISLLILICLILFYSLSVNASENRIIFKIEENVFTLLDLEKRIQYLDFVGSNENLDERTVMNDFISANLFYEFYQRSDNKINYKNKIEEIFTNIINTNKDNNKKYNYEINKANLLKHIEIDFIRKNILENILNSSINNFNTSKEEIDLLYNLRIKYINFTINNTQEILNQINILKINNFEKIKNFLEDNNIEFFVKEKEIRNINKIDKRISKNILSNNNYFVIKDGNKLSIIFIEKTFETLDGIIANLYRVPSKEELDEKFLKCANLRNLNNNSNIISKEYKLIDLNKELKKNLVNINDYVKYISDNQNIYIVLCNIKFDRDILKNINLNKQINFNINDIENKFINKYSKTFNLKRFND